MFDPHDNPQLNAGPTVSLHTNGAGEVLGVDVISDWPISKEQTIRLLNDAIHKLKTASDNEEFSMEFLQVGGLS